MTNTQTALDDAAVIARRVFSHNDNHTAKLSAADDLAHFILGKQKTDDLDRLCDACASAFQILRDGAPTFEQAIRTFGGGAVKYIGHWEIDYLGHFGKADTLREAMESWRQEAAKTLIAAHDRRKTRDTPWPDRDGDILVFPEPESPAPIIGAENSDFNITPVREMLAALDETPIDSVECAAWAIRAAGDFKIAGNECHVDHLGITATGDTLKTAANVWLITARHICEGTPA